MYVHNMDVYMQAVQRECGKANSKPTPNRGWQFLDLPTVIMLYMIWIWLGMCYWHSFW